MERKLIEATLERFNGHRAKTAQALGHRNSHAVRKAEGVWLRPAGEDRVKRREVEVGVKSFSLSAKANAELQR